MRDPRPSTVRKWRLRALLVTIAGAVAVVAGARGMVERTGHSAANLSLVIVGAAAVVAGVATYVLLAQRR